MTNSLLISIVVPIYNSAKFLKVCIESLLQQTYSGFEVLLINDGSTDETEKICNYYCDKYQNIKYYYKENSGVSDTRNFGIMKSNGEYITFVDSDDYLDKDFLLNFVNQIKKDDYDMLVCNHVIVENDKCTNDVLYGNSQDITFPYSINKYFKTYSLSTACKTLFKREFILNNKIYFNDKMNYGEDMLFSFSAYILSKKTYYLNFFGYYYVMNNSSASHNDSIKKREKYCIDNLDLYANIDELLKMKKYKYNQIFYLDALLKNLIYGIEKIIISNDNSKKEIIQKIKSKYLDNLDKYNFFKSHLSFDLKIKIYFFKKGKYNLLKKYLNLKRKLG